MVSVRRLAVVLALGPLFLVLAAACSGSGEPAGPTATPVAAINGELTVVSFEWGYEPEVIVLQQGEEVRLTLRNDGEILHNLNVDDLEVEVIEEISSGGFSGNDGELFVGAGSDDIGTITFVPLEPGVYDFYCTIGSHRQLGMERRLIVE